MLKTYTLKVGFTKKEDVKFLAASKDQAIIIANEIKKSKEAPNK
jgi:hypothetical protein